MACSFDSSWRQSDVDGMRGCCVHENAAALRARVALAHASSAPGSHVSRFVPAWSGATVVWCGAVRHYNVTSQDAVQHTHTVRHT